MDNQIEEETTQVKIKPRRAIKALLLSILTPGIGQIYNGQPMKGIFFLLLSDLSPFLYGLTKGATSFTGLIIIVIISICLIIFIIIDAIRNALKQKEYKRKKYNNWFLYLLIIIINLLFLSAIDISSVLGAKTFRITAISTCPTFEVGDRVVADINAYKINKPDYGDIIAYNSVQGNVWVFRVIGLPNDTLEISDNKVSINGKKCKTTFIKNTTIEETQVSEYEEILPNGHKHRMYINKIPFDSTKSTMTNIIVPYDGYYLLGDNRDNAADSRYFGSIYDNDIIGKMIYSYWGKTFNRININFKDK